LPNVPTLPPNVPVESQVPRRPRRRWGRFFFRTTVRTIVVLILIVGSILALIGFTPLSFKWADEKLKQSVEKSTGLHFTFRRAEWTISRGFLRVASPAFFDPATSEKLLELNDLEVNFGFGTIAKVLLGKSGTINVERITAAGPIEATLEENQGKFELDPKLRRLKELLQLQNNASKEEPSAPKTADPPSHKIHIGRIDLSGITLALNQINGDDRDPIVVLADGSFLAEFNNSSATPTSVLYVSRLQGRDSEAGLKLQVQPGESDSYGFKLTLQSFDSHAHLMTDLAVNFQTSASNIQGMLRRKAEGDWVVYANADIDKIVIEQPDPKEKSGELTKAKLYAGVEWTQKDDLLQLITVQLTSVQADLTGGGKLGLKEPYVCSAHLDKSEVRSEAIGFIERNFFKDSRLTRPSDGKVNLSGDLAGNFKDRKLESASMNFGVDQLTLVLPDFPEPITSLRVKGTLSNNDLVVSDAFAIVQGIPFNATGSFKGKKLLDGKVDRAELQWQTAGQAQGISNLITGNEIDVLSDFSFKGDVMSTGSFRVQNPEPGKWSELIDKAKIESQVKFNDAEVVYAKLKKPVRKLQGTMDIKSNKATFKDVSGRIEDFEFSINGFITGKQQFWKDSRTTFTVQASMDLAHLKDYFEWLDIKPPEDFPEIKGHAKISGTAGGPFKDWRSFDFRADALAQDFVLPIKTEHFKGTAHAPILQLAIKSDEAKIVKAEGDVEGVPVRIEGDLTPNLVRLTLHSEAPATEFKRLAGDVLEDYTVGGQLAVAHTVKLERKDQQKYPARTFAELLPEPDSQNKPPRDIETPLKDKWSFANTGQFDFKNGEVTFYLMPTHVSNIFGKINYDDDHLWTGGPIAIRPEIMRAIPRRTLRSFLEKRGMRPT